MKTLSRMVTGMVAIALICGAFGAADVAYAKKKNDKKKEDSTAKCAAGFAKAFPEAVLKAQKKGGSSILPVVTGTFEGYVKFTTKDKKGKSKTQYYKVKCDKISGPSNYY